jgi:cell wall-associated NlpC family hydrolase
MIPFQMSQFQVQETTTPGDKFHAYLETRRQEDYDKKEAKAKVRLEASVYEAAQRAQEAADTITGIEAQMMGVGPRMGNLGDTAVGVLGLLRGEVPTSQGVVAGRKQADMSSRLQALDMERQGGLRELQMAGQEYSAGTKALNEFEDRSLARSAGLAEREMMENTDRAKSADQKNLTLEELASRERMNRAGIAGDIKKEQVRGAYQMQTERLKIAARATSDQFTAAQKEADREHQKAMKILDAELKAATTPQQKANAMKGKAQANLWKAESDLEGARARLEAAKELGYPQEELAKLSLDVSAKAAAYDSASKAFDKEPSMVPTGAVNRIDEAAQKWIGTPYKFGGQSSKGVDCSAMVQSVYKQAGVAMPRTAREQYTKGVAVSPEDLQPGDLIFLQGTQKALPGGVASHVGIYLGDGIIQHASVKRGVIREKMGAMWDQKFLGIRRVVGS